MGGEGDQAGQFRKPSGLAIDKNDCIYVAEIGNSRIQKFSPQGEFQYMFGSIGQGIGEFANIHGLVIGKNGDLYVADTGNHRIQVFRVK